MATFSIQWDSARSRDTDPPHFESGSAVTLKGGDGRVGNVIGAPRRLGDSWEYDVRFGVSGSKVLESDLAGAVVSAQSAVEWLNKIFLSSTDLSLLLTLAKLDTPLTDVLYSFGSTRTTFRSYQFKPLLKLMNSATQRLLIADEVGLGKTIEAGLIWAEIDQRSDLRRGLIVCPASLTRKWQGEMKRRFDRDVEILDRRRLRELVAQLKEGHDPRINAVISLESLRTAPELEELAELSPRFDLVIVDEAHALRNIGTRSFGLGEMLSDWADVLLFLSATPLNLGRQDLFNLLHLLNPDDYPDAVVFESQLAPNQAINRAVSLLRSDDTEPIDILAVLVDVTRTAAGASLIERVEFQRAVEFLRKPDLSLADRSEVMRLLFALNTLSCTVTRTRKVDTPDAKATRVARTVEVFWTAAEARLYQAILNWARERALRNSGVIGFATIMPLRQAASCLPASKRILLQRWDELSDDDDDFDDVDGLDEGDERPFALSEAGEELKVALRDLVDVDTKFDAFESMLSDLRAEGIPQVMVFSFFRGTLKYLSERLHPQWRIRVMDGSIKSMDDRARIMQDFRDGAFDVLLVSEVASEGLDFEFCGALVNYDLPWNPMKVEQRIGRLDRFGQKFERIQIFNFHVPGTIETDIISRLYARIRVFEESIGELEPIIRDDMSEITKLVLDPRRTDDERRREVQRIELALETKHAELKDIETASTSMLTGLDQVLIDGLERDTKDRGKYVGESEIALLLARFLDMNGGVLRSPRRGERFHQVIGTPDVAQIAQASLREGGHTLGRLASPLREGEPIPATFNPELAMESAAEFLTLAHPLVRAAVTALSTGFVFSNRFAAASLESLSGDDEYLTLVALVEANGVRPIREIRTPTVRLGTLGRNDEVGERLMAAHARGDLPVVATPRMPDQACVEHLEDIMRSVRSDLEASHRLTNEALIDGRASTIQRTYDSKVTRAKATLRKVEVDGRAESIVRLHKGRIANLQTECELALQTLESQREFSVTWRPLCLVLVTGVPS